MIENHYEINLATNGHHYARVMLPSHLAEDQARTRFERIATALNDSSGDTNEVWSITLSHVECSGRDIAEFKL